MRFKGFTLIELMIVIAIISILASIMVPNYMRARAQAQYTQCISNCKNIGTAMEMYSTDNEGHYPTAGMTKLTPHYISVIPSCLSAGSSTVYTSSFSCRMNPDAYTFYCRGSNHVILYVEPNFPQYSSTSGLRLRR